MFKHKLAFSFSIIFILGLLLQINRFDFLLHFIKNDNIYSNRAPQVIAEPLAAQAMHKDTFTVVYDDEDVESTYMKHILDQQITTYMKKTVKNIALEVGSTATMPFAGDTAVLWACENFSGQLWNSALQYTAAGGTLEILSTNTVHQHAALWPLLGITAISQHITTPGIAFPGDFMVGAKGFHTDPADKGYNNYSLDCSLSSDCQVLCTSADGIPLVWKKPCGKGRLIVFNGTTVYTKDNRGLLTAMLAQSRPDFLYPVCATETIFIDDFPAPIPAGSEAKIQRDYGMTTAQFYEHVWWPYMLKLSQRYNLKYTGLVIETYQDNVSGNFHMDNEQNRRNLIVYGRELLNDGGELGIHGYNHQSLVCSPSYGTKKYLGYKIWPNEHAMEESLLELNRYIHSAFPNYQIHAYVPPSNVLSPEGKQALRQAFPHLEAFCSLYSGDDSREKAYYQNFQRDPDGIYEFPRVTSGYSPDSIMYFNAINAINTYGIMSHFVHPDEVFYSESGNEGFKEMHKTFTKFIDYFHDRYGWLHSYTLSDTLKHFASYWDLRYAYQQDATGIAIDSWHYHNTACYILRSQKQVHAVKGCTVQKISGGAYLITIDAPQAAIAFGPAAAKQ